MALHARLEDIFRSVLDSDDLVLRDDTAAADIDGWDSLAHITLMYTIEEMFGVQFSADEFARFTNVGDLKRSLEQRGFH